MTGIRLVSAAALSIAVGLAAGAAAAQVSADGNKARAGSAALTKADGAPKSQRTDRGVRARPKGQSSDDPDGRGGSVEADRPARLTIDPPEPDRTAAGRLDDHSAVMGVVAEYKPAAKPAIDPPEPDKTATGRHVDRSAVVGGAVEYNPATTLAVDPPSPDKTGAARHKSRNDEKGGLVRDSRTRPRAEPDQSGTSADSPTFAAGGSTGATTDQPVKAGGFTSATTDQPVKVGGAKDVTTDQPVKAGGLQETGTQGPSKTGGSKGQDAGLGSLDVLSSLGKLFGNSRGGDQGDVLARSNPRTEAATTFKGTASDQRLQDASADATSKTLNLFNGAAAGRTGPDLSGAPRGTGDTAGQASARSTPRTTDAPNIAGGRGSTAGLLRK